MITFIIILGVLCYFALPLSLILMITESEKEINRSRRSLEKAWEWIDPNDKRRKCKQCGTCLWWNVDKRKPSGVLLKDNARCLNSDSTDHMNLMTYTEGQDCAVYKKIKEES